MVRYDMMWYGILWYGMVGLAMQHAHTTPVGLYYIATNKLVSSLYMPYQLSGRCAVSSHLFSSGLFSSRHARSSGKSHEV